MSADAPTTVRIQAMLNTLQPSERRVADLIVGEPEVVVELTAQELADRAGVARSSVVRACQTFGYRGYPQLRVALAAELGGQTDRSADHGSSVLGRMRTAIDRAAQSLPAATALMDERVVAHAVTAIAHARRVLVVANGLSAPVASDLAMRLTAVGRPAEIVADAIAQQIAARQLSASDVCIVVSGSGANEASLRAAGAALSGGAEVIAVTSFASSPLVDVAALALVIAPAGASFRDELVHTSRAAHAVFAEVLVEAVADELPERAREVRAQVLEILSDNLGEGVPSER
ncbi:MAG: MurR/RpiR family transcriptional regulator [Actinobacteria bacterium]|nr:MurR/RpiR family transcriptional regulator [Actinomycetota bacterium]